MSQYTMDFTHFDAESFIVRRLKDHGREVFTGVSDPATRRERIRAAILEGGLEYAILGRNLAGKPETYAAAFERLYGEPLQHINPPKTRGKSHAQT